MKDSSFEYYKLETFSSFSLEVSSWEDSELYCEVNRARYRPQNHFMVTSQDTDIGVYIWDLSKHPSFLTDNEGNGDVGEYPFAPQFLCVGHTPLQGIDRDLLYGAVYTKCYSVR